MTAARRAEIQACLDALNGLATGTFYSLEELIKAMPPGVSRKTLMVTLDHTMALRITSRVTNYFVIRRKTNREDYLTICGSERLPAPGEDDSAEGRLKRLEEEVLELQTPERGQHYWLSLRMDRMPATLRTQLRKQAALVAGAGASDSVIETQMLLIAARVLQHAFKPPTSKDISHGLPPTPIY